MSFTALWKSRRAEVQKMVWPLGPRGWLFTARKKGGSTSTSICIDTCCIKWGFIPSNVFFLTFYFRGLMYFVAGCKVKTIFYCDISMQEMAYYFKPTYDQEHKIRQHVEGESYTHAVQSATDWQQCWYWLKSIFQHIECYFSEI